MWTLIMTNKHFMKKINRVVFVLAAAALLAGCGAKGDKKAEQAQSAAPVEEKVPYVETVVATMRPVAQESSYSSTVEPYATNNIVSQAAGRIRKINVSSLFKHVRNANGR